jgi:hypothetical protein
MYCMCTACILHVCVLEAYVKHTCHPSSPLCLCNPSLAPPLACPRPRLAVITPTTRPALIGLPSCLLSHHRAPSEPDDHPHHDGHPHWYVHSYTHSLHYDMPCRRGQTIEHPRAHAGPSVQLPNWVVYVPVTVTAVQACTCMAVCAAGPSSDCQVQCK